MPTSIASPADATNAALRLLGRSERVGHLYDGSGAAQAFLDIYGQVRDATLRSRSWSFAQQQALLVPTGAQLAILGWPYTYLWPDNCVLVRAVLPTPFPSPDFDPVDVLFSPYQGKTAVQLTSDSGVPLFADDGVTPMTGDSTGDSRVIATTISPATALFTARITDPTQWDVGFTSAFIGNLADVVKAGLAANPNMIREIDAAAAQSMVEAISNSELQPPLDIAMIAGPPR